MALFQCEWKFVLSETVADKKHILLAESNLKSAVLDRQGDAIRFNPSLLKFAAHYRFEPRPCAPIVEMRRKQKKEESVYRHTSFLVEIGK